MSLPATITGSSIYAFGYNDQGVPEAVVFCTAPTECQDCHTLHFFMVVNEAREYRCSGCAGRLK